MEEEEMEFPGKFLKNPFVPYIMVAFIDQVNIHQVPTMEPRTVEDVGNTLRNKIVRIPGRT